MIEEIPTDGIRTIHREIEELRKKNNNDVEIIKSSKIHQLNEDFEVFDVIIKDLNESFYTSDSDKSIKCKFGRTKKCILN